MEIFEGDESKFINSILWAIFSNILENMGFHNYFMYFINFCKFAAVPGFNCITK